MKRILLFITALFFSSLGYSQKHIVCLEYNNYWRYSGSNIQIGVFEIYLNIDNNHTNDYDSYHFIVNGSSDTPFEEMGYIKEPEEIEDFRILDNEELREMSPCDLHSLLSDSKGVLIFKRDLETGKVRVWESFYQGTSRSRIGVKF